MTIYRAPHPERNFTIVGNVCCDDPNLKNADLGLLLRILRLPPWASTNVADLAKRSRDGETAVRASLKRLEAAGYVRRQRSRKKDGTWQTSTFVFDEPTRSGVVEQEDARREQVGSAVEPGGTDPFPELDVSAGQIHSGFSTVDATCTDAEKSDVSAGQNQQRFSTVDNPPWINHGGSPPNYVSTAGKTKPTNEPSAGRSPAEAIADALVAGLHSVDHELAARIGRRTLAAQCERLVQLGWTPEGVQHWAAHAGWQGAGPGAVIERVKGLGDPPAPRTVEPAPANLCPVHGEVMRAGTCPRCVAGHKQVDAARAAAAVRARIRPMAGVVSGSSGGEDR